ncbi:MULTISPECIES: efflux RND transporter permease subunit [unclassified Novosphingobium]|uniref:efflux RND transporter permease subunit n=1 Tax=unclassified Novosphingobium TaxID=2644732 RepID=UPI001469F201|nr:MULTISPECIES: efflux RND transporter permease subunit [unclassified Novosphingobium]NMN06560.1 multidrug efflux pump [Novosphingobium sp. SG919]NMN88990.1 multidrug efflux pump [Novosphingobium sp. SG916]
MTISAPFIRRPVGTLLLTIGLMLAGVAAFFNLPVAPLPAVDFPTIMVQANLPGASPETMASTVAAPLERHLGTIAGVTEMTSRSGVGSSQITLQFDLSRNIDGAARDVQAAINAARADLPATLKSNPSYRKANPAEAPVLILALTSDTRSPSEIYDAVSNVVQQKLLQVQGVGNVELGGAALPSVRIEVNPLALSRAGIALEDVRTALQSESANRPRGILDTGNGSFQVYSNQAGRHAADYRDTVIAWRNGAAVRLSDIANVTDGPEDVRTMGLFNGKRAVPILISRQPGANIVETVDALKAQLPALRAALPPDIHLSIGSDRTATIRASLHEVEVTLLIATLLVVLVVGLFLQSWRATLIPAAAVVASLLGTLGVMYLAGFSLDNLSLMALTVATGFVVDDAIVVVENISRHVEEGMAPIPAALRGAREVGFTVMSISVSLVAVFVPLIFMGGLVGRLFREFALTMSVAVAISLVVSLTTTPMLAARLLDGQESKSWVMRKARAWVEWSEARYARNLDWALAHRGLVMLVLVLTVALNVWLIAIAPKGFFPQQDTGGLMGGVRADQSISFADLQDKLTRITRIVKSDPAVDTVVSFAGGSRAGGGFLFATLKDRSQRPPATEVIARLRPKLARVRGVSLFLNPVQDLQAGGRQTNSSYQYVLKADHADVLQAAGQKLVDALKTHGDLITDVDIDQQDAGADAFVEVDRDAAARLGIPMQTVDATLYDAFGQRQVANIYSGLNQYHVVMEADRQFNGSPEALNNIYLPVGNAISSASSAANLTGSGGAAAGGALVASGSAVSTSARTMTPLSAIARWNTGSTDASVSHSDGEPSATISFNLPPGVSLGQASQLIAQVQASLALPATVHGEFGGTAKVFAQSTASMPLLIVAALVAIYIVLGMLYESAIHPLTALSTIPSAGVGAMIALIASGGQFDIIALIGIILLIGIVKKNAIMIIDFALEAERNEGLAPVDAVREACLKRFRPILMTTLAAALGALPLAIGFGDGAELRRPLGIAIFGGLVASQVLTLMTTPVVYLALDRFRRRPRRAAPPAPIQGVPA